MKKTKIIHKNEKHPNLKVGEKYTLLYFDDSGNIKLSYIKLKGVERCKYSSKKNALKLIYCEKHTRHEIVHYLYGRPVSIYRGWKKIKNATISKKDKKFDFNDFKNFTELLGKPMEIYNFAEFDC